MSGSICKICGNEKDNQTYEVKEMMFGFRDEFTYLECSSCGCLQINEIPENISKYYPSSYYSFSENPLTPLVYSAVTSIVKSLEKRRNVYAISKVGSIGRLIYLLSSDGTVESLSKISLKRDSWILDVGCGSGELLYSFRQAGFKNLLGVDDFVKRDIIHPNRIKILKGSLDRIVGKWDLIMFNHTLEHMSSQLTTLKAVSSLLTDNGLCIINFPTVSSYAWKTYGTNWVQLDAPRHYFLHSVHSLKLLAEKAGLEVKKIFYNSTSFQFWGSEQYLKGIPLCSTQSLNENPLRTAVSVLYLRRFERRARELNQINQGDQAAFYIMKKK
jgi:2-polyprenyl-3-methyl-5-hydroxy-6-metoxy-1,4-benzoquinol methylase